MSADMSAESIQQKIQIARRDAEALKDRIKRKKDELADTSRECCPRWSCAIPIGTLSWYLYSILTLALQCVMSRDND